MKGFVPTPSPIVNLMVEKLFSTSLPSENQTILDPGCGDGLFIEGILEYCKNKSAPYPKIVGIESNPLHVTNARKKLHKFDNVKILFQDYLTEYPGKYDYIIGNPPYTPITELSEEEKQVYRCLFKTAQQRFNLYLLFFEQSIKNLNKNGRMVFITPEKFLYVKTASFIRELMASKTVEEIQMINEKSFKNLTTYPTITTIINKKTSKQTRIIFRDGKTINVTLPKNGESWLPIINGEKNPEKSFNLINFCIRVSCGVATGADSVFIINKKDLPPSLKKYAYPTISGKQLTTKNDLFHTEDVILLPYHKSGCLFREDELKDLRSDLMEDRNYQKLLNRTCILRKSWYAFHENPPIDDILKPKILCKDITSKPFFWMDKRGKIIPRHSVYYIVPKNPDLLEKICEQLNSEETTKWLERNCQRVYK